MNQLGVSCGPFVVNTQRHARWIWDLRRARRDPAGSGLNDLDPQVLTMVLRFRRGRGRASGHHGGGVASLPASAGPGGDRDGV